MFGADDSQCMRGDTTLLIFPITTPHKRTIGRSPCLGSISLLPHTITCVAWLLITLYTQVDSVREFSERTHNSVILYTVNRSVPKPLANTPRLGQVSTTCYVRPRLALLSVRAGSYSDPQSFMLDHVVCPVVEFLYDQDEWERMTKMKKRNVQQLGFPGSHLP